MTDFLKDSKIRKKSRLFAWVLAAAIILNTCSNGIIPDVFAEGEDVSVTVTNDSEITFAFEESCSITDVDDTKEWADMSAEEKKTCFDSLFSVENVSSDDIDMNQIDIAIQWETGSSYAETLTVKLSEGWITLNESMFDRAGFFHSKIEINNNVFFKKTTSENIIGQFYANVDVVCQYKDSEYITTGAAIKLSSSQDVLYYIEVLPDERGNVSAGSKILSASGDKIDVKFTPEQDFVISGIFENDNNIFQEGNLNGDGSYTVSYDYDTLNSEGWDKNISVYAKYEYKKTKFSDVTVGAADNTLYLGQDYLCETEVNKYNPNVTVEWKFVAGENEYSGVDVKESSETGVVISLNDKAKDGDVFNVMAESSDNVTASSEELQVSIPQAVETVDYDYFYSDDSKAVKNNDWYGREIFLKIVAGSGYNAIELDGEENYTESVEIAATVSEGELRFRLLELDADGKPVTISAWCTPKLNIDTKKPIITNISSSLAPGEWSNTGVAITVSAQDSESSIVSVKYSLTESFDDAIEAKAGQEGYTFTTVESDGERPVYYIWAEDKAGHISEVTQVSVNVEYTKPHIVSVDNISAGQWVNEGHRITVGVKDDNVSSGISYLTYKMGAGQEVKVTDKEIVGDTVYFSFDTLKEGSGYKTDINEYSIAAFDSAGNRSETTKTSVMVDKTPSIITAMKLTTDDGWQEHRLNTSWGHFSNNKVNVHINIEKNSNLSRVQTVTLSYEDSENKTITVTGTANAVGTPENNIQEYAALLELEPELLPYGYRNLRVKAEDESGNVSEEKTYGQLNNIAADNRDVNNLLIERTLPEIKFDVDSVSGEGVYRDKDGRVWLDSHRSVALTISDSASGIYKYNKKLNEKLVKYTEFNSMIKEVPDEAISTDSKTEEGFVIEAKDRFQYKLETEVVDNAGNANSASCSVYVDMISPKTQSVTASASGWTSEESVTISVKAMDEGSGVKEVMYYSEAFDVKVEVPADRKELNKWLSENASKADKITEDEYKFTAKGEQNKIYYIWTVDNVGNISKVTTKSVQIDLTTPKADSINLENIVLSSDFGNFANTDVKVLLKVSDGSISSNINSVELLRDNKIIDESVVTVTPNNLYEWVIPLNKEYENLSVKIIDNVGHTFTSSIKDISDNDAIKNSNIILEDTASSIDTEIDSDSVNINEGEWVGGDTEFIIAVSDKKSEIKSGINSVTAEINGIKAFSRSYDSIVTEDKYNVSTAYNDLSSSIPQPEDGKYTLKVVVKDNAGNESEAERTIYIDRESPVVQSVELFSTEQISTGNYKSFTNENMLSFGNFYNTDVMVRVTFQDSSPSSGIDISNVYLYTGDDYILPYFVMPGDRTLNQSVALFKIEMPVDTELSTEIIDNVGHSSGKEGISKFSGSIKNDNLMLENNKPNININEPTPVYDNKADNKKWYNNNIDFDITVNDTKSGLRSSEIKLNARTVISQKENLTEEQSLAEKSYKVNTSQAERAVDGSFTLSVRAVDNANNISEKTSKVFVDNTAPVITNYEFSLENYREGSPSPISTENYGYYFKERVDVTISAEDAAPSAGLKKIMYYFDSVSAGKSEVSEQNIKDGKISFEVPKGFKGKIYTNAVDNVGNESGWQTVDGTIREESDLHNISSDVKIEPQVQTDKKTSDGYDLYSADVPVLLHVEDKFSGVRKIEWMVEAEGDTSQNQSGILNIDNAGQLADDSDWNVLQRDNNLCTVLEKNILVSNNSNDIRITVIMTDRGGNISENRQIFSIDKTAPEITVSYDNNEDDADFDGYFKNTRVASVSIRERNFNPADVIFEIQNTETKEPAKTEWIKSDNGSGNYDNAEYTMNILYQDDGDYTFAVKYTDMAGNGNANVDYGNSVAPEAFTVDMNPPTITVTFDNNNAYVNNQYYYQQKRVASITIDEHNFEESRVVVNITSKDNRGGDAGNLPTVSGWSEAGADERRATVSFDEDSNYTISVQYIDMAGNEAVKSDEEKFCIDQKDPEIRISGVNNREATNAEEVKPVVEITDTNIDITKVTLSSVKNGELDLKEPNSPNDETKVYALDNIQEDDIYTLSAETTDKSGRPKKEELKFSVNRNGSTYEISRETMKMMESNNGYTNSPVDVIVTEINVNSLSQDSVSVVVARDNNPVELKQDIDGGVNDYSITRGADDEEWNTWSEYTYTIRKKNFDKDGNYIVRLYSEDEADNISQNDLQDRKKEEVMEEVGQQEEPEESKAEIKFNVDKTEPNLSILNIEDGATYPEDTRTASISVEDNTYVSDVSIYVNDEIYEHYDTDEIREKSLNNEMYEAVIANSNEKQNIRIVAVDAAGNDMMVEKNDFYVTTNLWIRFINNKPLFYGVIVGGILVILGIASALLVSGRKKSQQQ